MTKIGLHLSPLLFLLRAVYASFLRFLKAFLALSLRFLYAFFDPLFCLRFDSSECLRSSNAHSGTSTYQCTPSFLPRRIPGPISSTIRAYMLSYLLNQQFNLTNTCVTQVFQAQLTTSRLLFTIKYGPSCTAGIRSL